MRSGCWSCGAGAGCWCCVVLGGLLAAALVIYPSCPSHPQSPSTLHPTHLTFFSSLELCKTPSDPALPPPQSSLSLPPHSASATRGHFSLASSSFLIFYYLVAAGVRRASKLSSRSRLLTSIRLQPLRPETRDLLSRAGVSNLSDASFPSSILEARRLILLFCTRQPFIPARSWRTAPALLSAISCLVVRLTTMRQHPRQSYRGFVLPTSCRGMAMLMAVMDQRIARSSTAFVLFFYRIAPPRYQAGW